MLCIEDKAVISGGFEDTFSGGEVTIPDKVFEVGIKEGVGDFAVVEVNMVGHSIFVGIFCKFSYGNRYRLFMQSYGFEGT